MNKAISRSIDKEEKVIGNLKDQFRKKTLRFQRSVAISPDIANGNIALAYHRGLAVAREDTIKEIVHILKKHFPKASAFVKQHYRKQQS